MAPLIFIIVLSVLDVMRINIIIMVGVDVPKFKVWQSQHEIFSRLIMAYRFQK